MAGRATAASATMVRFLEACAVALATLSSYASALKNPIVPGWNPDPHVLRVNDTYYLAVSSFLTYPAIPIYKSTDLASWELVSHALDSPGKVPLHGIRKDNGVWAPSLSYIDGLFYMTSMAVWGSDPTYRTYPRMFWVSSPDLRTWSDVVWAEPNGIDPHLFRDPATGSTYLTVMGLNNNYDRLWGISQCRVDLASGSCLGPFRRVWNGTLPVTPGARPEGPKLFLRDGRYYLLIAEGGTGTAHRATIARSDSPEGPWEASPTNPLLFNGANAALTVGNTGHASFADTPDGRWFTTFLARRWVGSDSVLGREAFFAPVEWNEDGWPVVNGGDPVLLSQSYDYGPDQEYPRPPYEDDFSGSELVPSWYELRTPYTRNYFLRSADLGERQATSNATAGGVILVPNVYTLSDRDTPAAVLRKQTSVNMTFTATLLPTSEGLGPRQSVGISAYSYEGAHQDIGVRGCANATGQCIFVDSTVNSPGPGTPPRTSEFSIGPTSIPDDLRLHIRSEPTLFQLGYSIAGDDVIWVHEFPPSDLPVGFDGAMFALFASGNGLPWPFDAPEVGFSSVREEYFDEGFKDYKNG